MKNEVENSNVILVKLVQLTKLTDRVGYALRDNDTTCLCLNYSDNSARLLDEYMGWSKAKEMAVLGWAFEQLCLLGLLPDFAGSVGDGKESCVILYLEHQPPQDFYDANITYAALRALEWVFTSAPAHPPPADPLREPEEGE